MKAAYFHPDNTGQLLCVKTPMRVALDRAGIDVVDINGSSAGARGESSTCDPDTGDANYSIATIEQARDLDVWISEACTTGETDQLGPYTCEEPRIPLVVVEPCANIASNDHGNAALQIVRKADHIVTTSSATARYFEKLRPRGLTLLSTFVDDHPYRAAHQVRELHKSRLAAQLRLPETSPWLLTDGPMEAGESFQSYEVLTLALSRLVTLDWKLIVIAGGNAVADVKRLMLRLPQDRIRYCDPMTLPIFFSLVRKLRLVRLARSW